MTKEYKATRAYRCPRCKGTGKIFMTAITPEVLVDMQTMHKAGVSLRKIGEKVGIPHPETVKYWLGKKLLVPRL